MREFVCPVCSKKFKLKNWIINNRKKKNPNGVVCCSCSCARKLKTKENAPNWKGGVSKKQYERYRKSFPKKWKAHNKVQWAVKIGKLIPNKICEKCLKKSKTEAHHYDYNKPLKVTWLCHKCHMGEHYGKRV